MDYHFHRLTTPGPLTPAGRPGWFALSGFRAPTAHEAKGLRSYWLRSLLAPASSLRWNHFLTRFHREQGARDPVARVLAKPIRSYLRRGLGARRRVAILIETYDWLQRRFGRDFLRRFCSNENLPVLTLAARKGSAYTVFCSASINAVLQREGEIALFIAKSETDPMLCRIAMTYTRIGERSVLAIGGLQGPQSTHKREVIDATREMHGLRPKDAVLLAARALAEAAGVDEVHAVSDGNHVLNRLQDKSKFSSYDEYWRERGAAAGGPFGFVFPPLAVGGPEDDNKRGGLKRQIVAATREFARVNRR